MSDDLVERVALAICEDAGMACHCRIACAICKVDARAAIALVLEEAAKVAEGMWWQGHSNLATAPYAAAEQAGEEIAAAIRAMIQKGPA